jgi:hypothetical protein
MFFPAAIEKFSKKRKPEKHKGATFVFYWIWQHELRWWADVLAYQKGKNRYAPAA